MTFLFLLPAVIGETVTEVIEDRTGAVLFSSKHTHTKTIGLATVTDLLAYYTLLRNDYKTV